MKTRIDLDALHAQLCNALETEQGAVRIYDTAHRLAAAPALLQRAAKGLDEARRNEAALLSILTELGFDAGAEGPCRRAVRHVGEALAATMHGAGRGRLDVIEECLRLADTRERANWELFGQLLTPRRIDAGTVPANAPRRGHEWMHAAARSRVGQAHAAPQAAAA